MHSAEDLGVVGDFGAICKTSKTPVSGAGPHSDICGKTSFFCLYLVLVWVFSPLMTSFFLIFGINATRCKQASNNRQVLLCLFVISTSSSSKFTFCPSNFFFFFCLAFLQILFLPSSNFYQLCHPAGAAGAAAVSAELCKWPQPWVRGSRVFAAQQSSVLGIVFRQVRDSECFNTEGVTAFYCI